MELSDVVCSDKHSSNEKRDLILQSLTVARDRALGNSQPSGFLQQSALQKRDFTLMNTEELLKQHDELSAEIEVLRKRQKMVVALLPDEVQLSFLPPKPTFMSSQPNSEIQQYNEIDHHNDEEYRYHSGINSIEYNQPNDSDDFPDNNNNNYNNNNYNNINENNDDNYHNNS